jgi:hypothetical protein
VMFLNFNFGRHGDKNVLNITCALIYPISTLQPKLMKPTDEKYSAI